jgi:hypothetical protein
MNISVYHKSIPNSKNREKIDLLRYFSEGAKILKETVTDVHSYSYVPSHVAVLQGWISDKVSRPHLALRNEVINGQLKYGNHVVVVDSNLFLYANTNNPLHYLRYSFDGVFPTTGNYCDQYGVSSSRWEQIFKNIGISLKPNRTTGNHILLCLQRDGGWSMSGYSVLEWTANVILELREYTDRPIRVRPHPGDKAARGYLGDFENSDLLPGVTLSAVGSSLVDDLQDCWAAIGHNSSPTVGAAIEGVPIFLTDPERSQSREIANTDLSIIETPEFGDREPWVARLAMSHWNFDELKNGMCWAHMRRFI